MAEQFEVTQQEVAYQPEQATDFVREFDRHIAERDAMARPYEASLRNRAQQGVEDANKQVREMDQLAKLSNSLMSKLTDIQKKANEEQYAQGLADALMEDPDLMGQADLEMEEQNLVSGQQVANKTAARYEKEGGSKANARQIRNTGGWYGYGRFVGQLQNLGDNYGMALSQAKSNFTISIDGRELGYDQLKTKDEYNTWQRAFNAEYLKGVPRTNGDVVEKYVLSSVRQAANSDRMKWTEKYENNRQAEEKEDRQEEFMNAIKRGDSGVVEQAFATYPGSYIEIRTEIEDNLESLVKAGFMDAEEAVDFYENQTVIKDGKRQTMSQAFKKQYGEFVDKIEKARVGEAREYQASQAADAVELEQIVKSGDTLSDEQITQLQNSEKYANNQSAQTFLKNYRTTEDIEDDAARAHLDALHRSGDLTPDKLKGYNNRIQEEYESKAEENAGIVGDYDASAGEVVANGAAIEMLGIEQGTTPNKNDFTYQLYMQNAQALHKESYAQARRSGKTHTESMEYARQKVIEEVQAGGGSIKNAPAAVTLNNSVKVTRESVSKNPNIINEQVLPSTPSGALQSSFDYLRTGRGNMSGFYEALAQGQPYTAEDLVLAQAKAAGMDISKIEKNTTRQAREALPPELKRLVSVSPNTRTFAQAATRAVLGGEDTKYFLDTVASKESESYGGYDAYNLGGSNGGHTAHGSGNSADGKQFGKPVSQLTLGEIKRLHAQGKAHAMGRYQFVSGTFREVAALTGLPDDTVFNAKTQDLFAITRLIQRASWGSLQSGLASEWIGLQYLNSAQYQRLVQAAYGAIEENK